MKNKPLSIQIVIFIIIGIIISAYYPRSFLIKKEIILFAFLILTLLKTTIVLDKKKIHKKYKICFSILSIIWIIYIFIFISIPSINF